MSLYSKLRLLLKASAEEPARKLVEQNDIKIFEQEIYETENAIKSAKLHLANVKAEAKSLSRSIEELRETTALRERQTIEAMDKDEALANELAGLLAEDEIILKEQEHQLKHLQGLEAKLTSDLKKAVRAIQSHYRQLQILKVNQHSARNSQWMANHSRSLNGTLRDLNESLTSIKQRQLRESYLDEAEGEVEMSLSGASIDDRIAASGITTGKHDAAAVLERLKLKQSA